jgi:hypothetical protein
VSSLYLVNGLLLFIQKKKKFLAAEVPMSVSDVHVKATHEISMAITTEKQQNICELRF